MRASRASARGTAAIVVLLALGSVAVTFSLPGVFGSPRMGHTSPRTSGQAMAPRGSQVSRVGMQGAKEYWEGEWICADCGYIYNERSFGMKFEDQQMGYKCPSCAAPRRRFARKLGDKIGTTLDGGDTPIIIFSAVALLAVIVIAYFSLS
eukprot:CAMPEP_0170613356 /NCGR_PEP_ID=MMETSP0224-20130122/24229_1 /TAXON_ID=285029 /ORGANISM="Togula jolla, Strain CCCM 725" /LENGTH=149 /DNA_ID=CAMNT_0010938953 /DNA_START=64 /DNA_END=513 /DNA_ORIENTATION=+